MPMGAQSWLRTAPTGLAYVALFLVLDSLSQVGVFQKIGVTPWSPAAGLAVAYAYLKGPRSGPFLLAAPLLALQFVHPLPLSPATILIIGVGSASISFAAGSALHRIPGFEPSLRTLRAVLILFAIACVTALCQTALYVGTIWVASLITEVNLLPAAWRSIVGVLVGILVVTPLVLLMQAKRNWPIPHEVHLLQLIVLVGALSVIFGVPGAANYQVFYLLFLPVLWVALRDGIAGSVWVINACQIGIIIGAASRVGFYPGLGALQTMMIVLVMTGLLIGGAVTEAHAGAQRLRDQQAALNRSLRLRSAGETAAAIAHQINQPLTAISTYASVASDALDQGDATVAKTTIVKLVAECERAASVLRSIRDLVKQGGLTRAPATIQGIVAELAQLHAAECATNRITLDIAIAPNLPTLNCDRVQLQQALYNLINNSIESIKDSGRGGEIRVAVKQGDGAIIFEVKDDGPGFAAGVEELVAAPFTTTKLHGSGLGLAIARSVAEAHGGSLAIVPAQAGAIVRLVVPTNRVETI